MLKSITQKKGFTLIELFFYFGITATMILAFSMLYTVLLDGRAKNQAIAEVEAQGIQIMDTILHSIRNSEAINTPSPGNFSSTVSLSISSSTLNPTIFELSNGSIRIKEGGNSWINLTNSKIEATDFMVTNLSLPETSGSLRVFFTLKHINLGRNNFEYIKSFVGSASQRF